MKNIDDLRNTWKQISLDTTSGQSDSAEAKKRMRSLLLECESVPTVKERLIRRLRRPLLAALACLASTFVLIREFDIPGWFIILYYGFIVLAAVLTCYQIRLLRKADLTQMTTVDAIRFIRKFTIVRQRIKTVLISIGIPVVVLLMWVLDSHKEPLLLISGLAGAAIGAAAGIYMNHRFKKDLRLMERTLGRIDELS